MNDVQVNMAEDCQFLADLNADNQIGIYNLITSVSGVKLWTKGIKPNRHWKFKQVKEYFGLKGNAESVLAQLEKIYAIIKEKKGEKETK